MPQRKCAITELRKNQKRHLHNLDIKTDLKKSSKKFVAAVKDNKIDDAKTLLQNLYKKLDKAAKRNIFHKNTASRRKSYYARLLKTASSSN